MDGEWLPRVSFALHLNPRTTHKVKPKESTIIDVSVEVLEPPAGGQKYTWTSAPKSSHVPQQGGCAV